MTKNHGSCPPLGAAFLMVAGAALMSACSQAPAGSGARPATIQQINNSQRMDDVIALLNEGDVKAATKMLRQMAKSDPADRATARLLESLSADPKIFLGAKSFAYRVQPGDRLIDLSRRFLGDRLQFFALARYNEIAAPVSLKAGQLIRIPGDEPPKVAPTPRPAPPSPRPPEVAKPASLPPPAPKAPAADPAKAARLRASGLAALNQGQVARAVVLLHQASAAAPADPLIKRDLERAQRIRRTVKSKR